ncbi:ComEA family DNA-binding protein [Frateuria aurantia]
MSHRKGFLTGLLVSAALSGSLVAAAATPININTADAVSLTQALDGVGPSKAEAIVAWRKAHGPFKSLEDLRQVKGMGPSILQRNHDAIQFGQSKPKPAAATRKATRGKSSPADETSG